MYHHIRGRVTEKGPTHVVLEAGGVGYVVLVTPDTARALPASGEATLLTHLDVGEGFQRLFGFARDAERTLFRLLCTVSGIGPRKAHQMLSSCPADALAEALRAKDAGRLSRLRGVGTKTAQRLILELDGALASWDGGGDGRGTVRLDAVEALVTLGYDRKGAAERVDSVLGRNGGTPTLEETVRDAIRA